MSHRRRFICHCTVHKYDAGLQAGTAARPTIFVMARDQSDAYKEARRALYREYNRDGCIVTSVSVELINEAV